MQWQWEEFDDRRSPLLLVYGLVAGGSVIALVLLISFLQQNAAGLFTARTAAIVAAMTAASVALTWLAGRRGTIGIGRRRRHSRSRRSTHGKLQTICASVARGLHAGRRIGDFGGRRLAGGYGVDLR